MPTPKKDARETLKASPETQTTRVFLIEDHELVLTGVREIIDGAPQKDMAFVGSCGFGADACNLIREKGVDVVLIDIADSEFKPAGLTLVRDVRRQFGPTIGIVAYSMFTKQYREVSVECGADRFLYKGVTNDAHRQAIRTCKEHDLISEITLMIDTRDVRVVLTGKGVKHQEKIALGRDSFALLYYLAEERAANETCWVAKEDPESKAAPYRFREKEFWFAIRNRLNRFDPPDAATDRVFDISKLSHDINKPVKDALPVGSPALVIVPGPGNHAPQTQAYTRGSYFLNPFVASDHVSFQGERVRRPAKKK
jgi:DNA-binding NarL/FixJ family response regulator